MSAARHDLRHSLAVLHPLGFPLSDKITFFFDFAPLRFRRCSLIALFSTSRTSQRCRILSWSTASEMSCWTWNRSLTSYAPGNTFLTVSIMAEERSVVTVFTLRRCFSGTFLSIADTVSLATPRTIAARALCRHARLCWSGSYRHRRCSDRSRQDSCPPRNFQNTICIHRHDQADPISGNHLSSPCTVYARSDR